MSNNNINNDSSSSSNNILYINTYIMKRFYAVSPSCEFVKKSIIKLYTNEMDTRWKSGEKGKIIADVSTEWENKHQTSTTNHKNKCIEKRRRRRWCGRRRRNRLNERKWEKQHFKKMKFGTLVVGWVGLCVCVKCER